MGKIAAVGIHDDFPSGKSGVSVGAADDEIAGGIDEDIGNTFDVKAVIPENRGDDLRPDIPAQLGNLKIRAVHHGHHHGVDAHNVPRFVKFHGNLGLAVGAKQVDGVNALGQSAAQRPAQGGGQGHELLGLGTGTAEHHALISRAAHFVICAQGNVRGLGMNPAFHLNAVRVKAVPGIGIADFPDGIPSHLGVVHLGFGGDLAANDAEVRGDHGLAGHPGAGILRQTGIQDGIGDGVGNLVRVAVGYTFRGKESFFHNIFLSFARKMQKKTHTRRPDVR